MFDGALGIFHRPSAALLTNLLPKAPYTIILGIILFIDFISLLCRFDKRGLNIDYAPPNSSEFRILKRKGFTCVRQSGSHKIFKNDFGIRVTVPDHAGKILHPKILKQICKDADINPDELV